MNGLLLLAALTVSAASTPLPPGAIIRFGNRSDKGSIAALAYAPDGSLIAAGARDGTVRLYSPSNGRLIKRLSGHKDAVSSLAFSPDSRLLASGGEDKRLLLHEVRTGRLLRTIRPGRVAIRHLSFMPDGTRLVSDGERNNLEVWNAASGINERSLTEHAQRVSSMALSPDGRFIATSDGGGALHLWDTATGRRLFSDSAPPVRATSIGDLSFSSEGGTLTAVDRGFLRLVAVPGGESLSRIAFGDKEIVRPPDPGNSWISLLRSNASGGKWSLDIMDLSTGRRFNVFRNQVEAGMTITISPNGKSAAVAGPDGTGLVWTTAGGHAQSEAPPAGPSTGTMIALIESWIDPARANAYFDEQRRRYTEFEEYDPYGESTQDLLDALRNAIEDEDFKEALALADEILAAQPVLAEAHSHAAQACSKLGESTRERFHRLATRGLIDSALRSGDGKTPKTAFRTVYMGEQREIMVRLPGGREPLSRATLNSGGRMYDAWNFGPEDTIYFDITPIWTWNERRFGVSERPATKKKSPPSKRRRAP